MKTQSLPQREYKGIKLNHDGTCQCPKCGSNNAYIITRVTGYFGKTSAFNAGKIGEIRDRHINRSWQDK